jgi:hypothetical protein
MDDDWRNFVILVCVLAGLFCMAFCIDQGYSYNLSLKAMEKGYVQKVEVNRVIWVKPQTKVEQE